jgi:amino acid adenylation domain-containing protein
VPIKSVLLAAHFRVLSLLAGQPDVLSGVVANGRPERADGDQVLGLFLNSLPLRLRLGGGTWAELAQAAFELERESLGFRRFPLADLQRMEGGRPLFEIAFNFLHYHVYQSVTGIAGLDVLERAGYEETNFLFTVHFQVDPGTSHVRLLFNYQESELEAEEVAAVGRYYQAVLAAMAENPEARYETAPLLPAAELSQVLVEWNGAAGDLPTEPIHRVFERRAAERPEAVAVTCDGRSLTYGELNARANRLARRLRVSGVGPETPVAVALDRSIEMMVSLLAVLKAGGAYVPLDPAYPAERLAFVLADAGARLLLTADGMVLPEHGARVIRVDEETAAEGPVHDLPDGAGADNLAYVIYTSGSTGRPKGVQVTHANVSRLLTATEEWFGFGPDDVWTLFHSYAFDFSVWEMWGALLYGGRLVVVPHAVSRSPEAFHDLLASEKVTVLNQTPSAFRQLARVEDESPERACGLALRTVIFGGEALDVAALRTWIARYGTEGPRLVNMYGITETTVHVTYRVIAAEDLDDPASPIGGPIPDLRLYLLDPHGQPVPVGVPGELHVGGAGWPWGSSR